ncbi:MAG: DUF808 domain-containing protein [Lautropia sp.]|nr:DUF808 domain-containing protein [Lautropia sp.]
MAGASLLTLIDDIATLLDDVAVLTKKAGAKTAGVLGDDLALNAQQVSGVSVDRELPVVWAVFKGSLVNKLILVPLALAISAYAPWLVTPLLTIGGLFLCFEGAEKLVEKLFHHGHKTSDTDPSPSIPTHATGAPAGRADTPSSRPHAPLTGTTDSRSSHPSAARSVNAHTGSPSFAEAPSSGTSIGHVEDDTLDEKTRIKGAIRTDFILSAEIIAITLGTVADQPLPTQVMVLSAIALIMTVGVYGFVAGIVKLDDLGLYLSQRDNGLARSIGRGILRAAPWLMKGLGIAGTAAMFLVGGSIVMHGIPAIHHLVEPLLAQIEAYGGFIQTLASMVADALVGIVAGLIVVAVVTVIQKMRGKPAH